MLRRLTKQALETLEFRGTLVVLGLIGALILYFAVFHGHRSQREVVDPIPTVPSGEQPPPSRL